MTKATFPLTGLVPLDSQKKEEGKIMNKVDIF